MGQYCCLQLHDSCLCNWLIEDAGLFDRRDRGTHPSAEKPNESGCGRRKNDHFLLSFFKLRLFQKRVFLDGDSLTMSLDAAIELSQPEITPTNVQEFRKLSNGAGHTTKANIAAVFLDEPVADVSREHPRLVVVVPAATAQDSRSVKGREIAQIIIGCEFFS